MLDQVVDGVSKEVLDALALQDFGDGRLLDSGKRKPLQIKQGDQVLFSSYAGTEIKLNGEELLIVEESEILAILD